MMTALMALVLSTFHAPVVVGPGFTPADTGYDVGCDRLTQHWHNDDTSCHLDSDDSVVGPRLIITVTVDDAI